MGGTQIFLDGGGHALLGEDSPFMGYGPHHPPHVSQPWGPGAQGEVSAAFNGQMVVFA